MKHIILAWLVSALLLLTAACGVAPGETNVPDVQVTSPGEGGGVSGDQEASWQPAPGDENLNRAEVHLTGVEILTLESFPPQFMLHLSGEKGNPCNLLRVEVGEPDPENRIPVSVYTLYDPAAVCLAQLETFDINVPLEGLAPGTYSVWVNGDRVGEMVVPTVN